MGDKCPRAIPRYLASALCPWQGWVSLGSGLSCYLGSLPNLGVSLSLGHGLAPFRPSVPFPVPTTSLWDSIRCWPTILGRLVGLQREKRVKRQHSQTVAGESSAEPQQSISQSTNPPAHCATFHPSAKPWHLECPLSVVRYCSYTVVVVARSSSAGPSSTPAHQLRAAVKSIVATESCQHPPTWFSIVHPIKASE